MNGFPLPYEHDIQANFIKEIIFLYRNRDDFLDPLEYAVANGFIAGGESKKQKSRFLGKLKREGWKAGISDWHYDQPRGDFNKLVIEFKRADRRRDKNGGCSDLQVEFLEELSRYARVAVCYSEDEAIQVFNDYMNLPVRESRKKTIGEILEGK